MVQPFAHVIDPGPTSGNTCSASEELCCGVPIWGFVDLDFGCIFDKLASVFVVCCPEIVPFVSWNSSGVVAEPGNKLYA